MVETRLQKSRREAKEAQASTNMSVYEYDDDIFFNLDCNTLPDIDNYRNMEHIDNTNNATHSDAQEDNVDNVSVQTEEVEDTIVDPEFHRMVQEIMKKDRHYFLQLMAQNGTKIPHDFEISQIVENPPIQGNQGNMNQRRPSSGGNTRQHHVPESPSSLFQKPKIPNMHTQDHFVGTSH